MPLFIPARGDDIEGQAFDGAAKLAPVDLQAIIFPPMGYFDVDELRDSLPPPESEAMTLTQDDPAEKRPLENWIETVLTDTLVVDQRGAWDRAVEEAQRYFNLSPRPFEGYRWLLACLWLSHWPAIPGGMQRLPRKKTTLKAIAKAQRIAPPPFSFDLRLRQDGGGPSRTYRCALATTKAWDDDRSALAFRINQEILRNPPRRALRL